MRAISGESSCTAEYLGHLSKKGVKNWASELEMDQQTRQSRGKKVPKANGEGKRSLCGNLTSNHSQTGRSSKSSKLWSEGAFCVQVRAQHWQICCLDDISPAVCLQTAAGRAGQLQRGFCLLLVICMAELVGEAGSSDRPALACSRLAGLSISPPLRTVPSLRGDRGPVRRKRCNIPSFTLL